MTALWEGDFFLGETFYAITYDVDALMQQGLSRVSFSLGKLEGGQGNWRRHVKESTSFIAGVELQHGFLVSVSKQLSCQTQN